jgi:hypothetical protein
MRPIVIEPGVRAERDADQIGTESFNGGGFLHRADPIQLDQLIRHSE